MNVLGCTTQGTVNYTNIGTENVFFSAGISKSLISCTLVAKNSFLLKLAIF